MPLNLSSMEIAALKGLAALHGAPVWTVTATWHEGRVLDRGVQIFHPTTTEDGKPVRWLGQAIEVRLRERIVRIAWDSRGAVGDVGYAEIEG